MIELVHEIRIYLPLEHAYETVICLLLAQENKRYNQYVSILFSSQ